MAKNFLIAIGGRGSQTLEALIYQCALGSGPDNLEILIIDPDRSNQNSNRTNLLIDSYNNIQKITSGYKKIFNTDIKPEKKEHRDWSFLRTGKNNLNRFLGDPTIDTGGKEFRNLFFTNAELEQDLEKGFKGHPIIGATIFGDINLKEEEANKEESSLGRFIFELRSHLSHTKCNLFLIGSLFGGTGAAGLPTIAKKIADHFSEEDSKADINNLRIGGAFIAPYFYFLPEGLKPNELYAKSDLFLLNTRAVLANYDHLVKGVYDHVYLVGEQDIIKYEKFSTGGSTQSNKPHFVELVSAYSALDFFTRADKEDQPKLILWSRGGGVTDNGEKELDILDFRSFSELGVYNLKNNLIKFTMFYLIYTKFFQKRLENVLKQKYNSWKGNREPWYTEHFDKKIDADKFHNPENSKAFEDIKNFLTGEREDGGYGYTKWLNEVFENTEDVNVNLIRKNFESMKNIYMLDPDKEATKSRDTAFDDFYIEFMNVSHHEGQRGAEKFVYMIYEAVEKLHKRNYLAIDTE